MLLAEPAAEPLQVAVVVERSGYEAKGVEMVAALRRAGVVAELIATGSPKKRYDKAVKLNPAEIVSIDVRDDALSLNRRTLSADAVDSDAVAAVMAALAAM
jgi:histidyl-tRNA synthetase